MEACFSKAGRDSLVPGVSGPLLSSAACAVRANAEVQSTSRLGFFLPRRNVSKYGLWLLLILREPVRWVNGMTDLGRASCGVRRSRRNCAETGLSKWQCRLLISDSHAFKHAPMSMELIICYMIKQFFDPEMLKEMSILATL